MKTPSLATKRLVLPGGNVIQDAPIDWTEADGMAFLKENFPGSYKYALSPQSGAAVAASAPIPEPSVLEGIGLGSDEIFTGAKQLFGGMTPADEADFEYGMDLYERGRGPDAGFDWARGAGNVAATLPLALPSMVMAPGLGVGAILGALEGATAGGLLYAREPGDRIVNTALGGAGGLFAGLLGPPIVRGAAATGRAIHRGGRMLGNLGKPINVTAQLQQASSRAGLSPGDITDALRQAYDDIARKAMRTGGDFDPDVALRKARIEAAGFTGESAPTYGQITRDPTQWSDEQNLVFQGEPKLQKRMQAQDARILQRVDEIRASRGGLTDPSDLAADAGETVEASIRKIGKNWQKKVRAGYEAAKQQRPDAGIKPEAFSESMEPILRERRNAIPGDVRRRITELMGKDGPITPEDLEQLYQFANEYKGMEAGPNAALDLIKDAARDGMELIGEEYSETWGSAVKEAAKRFRGLGLSKKGPKSFVTKFWQGVQDPEKLPSLTRTGPYREVERLRALVAEADPKAWSMVRTATWNDIIENSMSGDKFLPGAFNRHIKNMGPRRLKAVFGDEGAAEIRELAQAVADLRTDPAWSSVNRSHSGNTILRSIARVGQLISALPGLDIAADAGAASMKNAAGQRTLRLAIQATPKAPIPPIPGARALSQLSQTASHGAAPSAGLVLEDYYRSR